MLEYGASPRGTIAVDRCARAYAWLQGKDFVSPDDVQAIIHDCLRHRLILSFEAEASGINSDKVIDKLLSAVPLS
jgi:MoxR-like ATPase